MEYLLGKGIDRVMRLRHGRKLKKWKKGRDPLRVKDLERRFSLFASVITGRSTSVVAMHGDPPPRPYAQLLYRAGHPSQLGEHAFSWTDGDSIFLPVSSIHMEDPADEEDLLKMSIFFHAFQMTAGTIRTAFRNRHALEADQELADIFWIIENKRLATLIRREFPLALERFAGLACALIDARPPMDWLRPSEARVEDFLRASVLDDAPLFSVRSATESLAMAGAVLDQWRSSSGRRALGDRYRAMVPFVLYGRLLPGRVKEEALLRDSRRDPDPDAPGDIINEKATEDAEKKRYVQKKEEVDEEANENGLALNIYDKFITWAEFVNVPRPFDDDPEDGLDKKADAMDEISQPR
jgi:nitric oxide reductase activation protein